MALYAQVSGTDLYAGAYDLSTGDCFAVHYAGRVIYRLHDANDDKSISPSEVSVVANGWAANQPADIAACRALSDRLPPS